jgi:hypothetical protein
VLNHLHRQQRTYPGDLKTNRAITVNGQHHIVSAWVTTITPVRGT